MSDSLVQPASTSANSTSKGAKTNRDIIPNINAKHRDIAPTPRTPCTPRASSAMHAMSPLSSMNRAKIKALGFLSCRWQAAKVATRSFAANNPNDFYETDL